MGNVVDTLITPYWSECDGLRGIRLRGKVKQEKEKRAPNDCRGYNQFVPARSRISDEPTND